LKHDKDLIGKSAIAGIFEKGKWGLEQLHRVPLNLPAASNPAGRQQQPLLFLWAI
jgi:hypothetical protein